MASSGRNDRSWILDHCYTNSYTGQTGEEYCPCLSLADYSGLSGGHGQGINSTGVTSTGYPGASFPGPSFHTPPQACPKIYEEVLSCDYTSRVPAMFSEKVLCDFGGNQDTDAYPASAPAEQWDTQAVPRPMFYPASYMQPPYVAPSPPLKNKVAVTSASPESSIAHGNVICDTGWNQDMGTYPAHASEWYSQVTLGPILGNTGYKQPASVAPSVFEDKAASIASAASTPKGPTHNTDKYCPICAALLGRFQDRKRHTLSHLPHWLQCQASGCSWRGDRWEHLRKHRSKVHPSNSQESDTRGSIIYDPWPLVKGITDNTTFEVAKTIAIFLVEEKAKEVNKLELWEDLWGRRRRSRKVYS